MTQSIQTYDSNALTLTTTDPQVTQLNLSISTSLMTNYEPSRSVDGQHAVDVAQDVNGNPMVFSIGTAGELYAITRGPDPKAPWSQTDLTSGLGAGWQAQTFRLLQTPQQTLYLALAIKDSGGASRLYLTGSLPNDPANAVWTGDFTSQWTERASATGFASIDHILMSAGPTSAAPPVVVATATVPGGQAQRYYVNGNTSSQVNLWQPWPVPQNASDIIDVAVGTMPILGAGSFVLYHVGGTVQLDFTKADMMRGQYISRTFTVPEGAMALGTLQDPDGSTDLYVAGDGIFVFTSNNMGANAVAQQIGGTIAASIGTEIVVRQDDANVTVWVLDDGVLYYTHGAKGTSDSWTAPLPIQKNVGQIAALRNTVRDTNELFLVTADAQLAYLYQDPTSTIWSEMLIPLADVGSVLPFRCYTTHIVLTDQNNNPVTKDFSISASEWTYLTVNGSALIVDQDTTNTITPDPTGSLTVMTKVSTLSAPTLQLTADFLPVVIDINPQSVVNNNLKLFTTESALTGATTQTGQPVISGTTPIPVSAAANALQQLTILHDSTAASNTSGVTTRTASATPANQIDVATLPTSWGFAVTGMGTASAVYYDTADASAAMPDLHAHSLRASSPAVPGLGLVTTDAGDEIKAFFGDVLRTIEHGLDKVGDILMHVVNDVVTFTIKLVDKTVSFIIDTVEKVMSVISWVLQQIAVALDKVIEWIGFLFDWDDILTAHAIIVNVANKALDYAESQVANAKPIVANFFDTIKTQFAQLAPLTGADASTSVLTQSKNPAPDFPDSQKQGAGYLKSPGGSFAKYHLQHSGVLGGTPPTAPAPTGNPIVDMFTQVIEPLGDDIGQTVDSLLLDLHDGFVSGTLTPSQALDLVKTDAIAGVLQTAEDASEGVLTVADDVITSMQDILDKTWHIPFLTPLYRLITKGAEPTLLDAVALLIAVPAVPMYKLVSEKSPFANGTYGLDDTSTPAEQFFTMLRGQSSEGRDSLDAAPTSETGAILYSQIGGCFYLVAEVVSMTVDAITTEVEGATPPALNYIWLACELVMEAGSFPIGDGAAVTLLRILWGLYLLALIRFVVMIFGGAAAVPGVGVSEMFLALVKAIFFLVAIFLQTEADSGTDLALEWETFFGNLLDATARGISGWAKTDPDKELSGLALDVIAVWLTLAAIAFDGIRLSIILGDDELKEYHCF